LAQSAKQKMNFWLQPFKSSLLIRFILSIAILTAIGISVYVSAISAPFLYDDNHAIINNTYIQNLNEFQEIVGIERVLSRSFLLLTYAINLHLGNEYSFGFHLFNTILHICSGILLFFLSCEFLEKENPELRFRLKNLPLTASLIHVLNPLNVETVVYISSRSSLLATFFYLAATLTFVRWKKKLNHKSLMVELLIYPSILTVVLFLGFGSKAIIATMPIMAIIYLWVFSDSLNQKKILLSTLPLFICLLVYLFIKRYQTGYIFSLGNDPSSFGQNRLPYLLTQFEVAIYYYALKLFFPINLNFEPDFRLISNFFSFKMSVSIGIIFSIWIMAIKSQSKIAKFGLVWIFITLAPTSTFIPLKQIATEHRLYLPAIGFCLVFGTFWLNASRFLTIRKLLFISTLLFMAVLSTNRSLDFKNETLIWKDVVKKSPKKVLAHNNLAIAFLNKDMDELAEKHLKIALKLNPAFKSANLNLGHIFFKRKNYLQAKKYFDLAIFYGENNGLIFYNAGLTQIRLNNSLEGIKYFKKAIALKPENSGYHYALGNAYKTLKRSDEAIKEYKKTLNLDPKNSSSQNNMGVIFFENGMHRLAEDAFLKTLRIDKQHAEAHNNLATLYLKTGKYELAVKNLKQYMVLKPFDLKKAGVLNTLQKLTGKTNE
jgi:protein O-mannosyl-transferase